GKDITSVQYQNANNSVRVSDEFMHAVENGRSFGLAARMTGETIETVDAKGLFRKMAQAAWECADPGIQYDDTINNWHTCPLTSGWSPTAASFRLVTWSGVPVTRSASPSIPTTSLPSRIRRTASSRQARPGT